MSDFDNPAQAGNDTALSSDSDTGFDWDYYDPDEDQDSEETPIESATEDEEEGEQEAAEAAEDEQEDTEDGESDSEEEETGEEVQPDVKVTLSDGSEVTLQELKDGYHRQSDYSRKTEALARERDEYQAKEQQLSEHAQRVIRTLETIDEFMESEVPKPPPPELAQEDFVAYVQQKAIYDHAVQRMGKLKDAIHNPQQVVNEIDQQRLQEFQQAENAKLAEHFPEMSDPVKREKLRETIQAATDEVGFSLEEIKGIADHRFFRLAHLAAQGLQAEKAKKTARMKSEKAPPVATPKAQKRKALKGKNRQAMTRLAKSGSIHDAVMVDFD